MIAKYILAGIAVFFGLLVVIEYRREGRLSGARRTYLRVAVIFLIIAAILHFGVS